jgi:phenylpyruvate tautomerase PptA (4-oxalocrotonate tautomerase family)
MPFIRTNTNVAVSAETAGRLSEQLGAAIRLIPGKTESWLMLEVNGGKQMFFAGSDAPLVLAEVTIYGHADDKAYDALTGKLTEIYAETLAVSPDRIYVKYAETDHWGWNGSNF